MIMCMYDYVYVCREKVLLGMRMRCDVVMYIHVIMYDHVYVCCKDIDMYMHVYRWCYVCMQYIHLYTKHE